MRSRRCFILMLMIAVLAFANNLYADVKAGEGKVEVRISERPVGSNDPLNIFLIYSPIFVGPHDAEVVKFDYNQGKYECSMPLLVPCGIAAVRVEDKNGECVGEGFVKVKRGSVVQIDVMQPDSAKMLWELASHDDPTTLLPAHDISAYSTNLAFRVADAITSFGSAYCGFAAGEIEMEPSSFDDWQAIAYWNSCRFNDKYNKATDHVDGFGQLQHLLKNNFRYGFAGNYVLDYRRWAKEWFDKVVDGYPDEYYAAFLKDIDFSEDAFLQVPPVGYTPYYFFYQLIDRFPEIEIKCYESIVDWRNYVKPRIERLGMNVDDTFYDFLLTAAYLKGIRANQILSEADTAQISANLSPDLCKIILDENRELKEALSQTFDIIPTTPDENIDIEEVIKKHFPGQPVIVDFWNTWCSPCLAAHKSMRKLKERNPGLFEGVAMLYVSDATSNPSELEILTPRIGGHHLYLSKEQSEKLMLNYVFEGIPAYLFFDKNGQLQYAGVAYPSDEKVVEILQSMQNIYHTSD